MYFIAYEIEVSVHPKTRMIINFGRLLRIWVGCCYIGRYFFLLSFIVETNCSVILTVFTAFASNGRMCLMCSRFRSMNCICMQMELACSNKSFYPKKTKPQQRQQQQPETKYRNASNTTNKIISRIHALLSQFTIRFVLYSLG